MTRIAVVGAEYNLGWLPRGTHRWRMFRKPCEIAALLAEGGFEVKDITGVAVNPIARILRRMMFCTRNAGTV